MGLIIGKEYYIKNVATGLYLNVYGYDTVGNGRNVTLYSKENVLAQKWKVVLSGNGAKVLTMINQGFGLNINQYDNNNCTMWPIVGNDADSIVDFLTIDASQNKYRIKMMAHNKFLRAEGTSNLSNVVWSEVVDNFTLWQLEEAEITQPEIPLEADSVLVDQFIPAYIGNYTQNRASEGGSISEICIHHVAGITSIESLGNLWQTVGRAGSSHYGISNTQVGQYVKEEDIAWTNGNWESNKRSVTIEVSNSSGAPNWLVSDSSINTLVELVADIATRNNLGKLFKGVNVTWHSMYSATACPGPYLLSKIQEIVDRANLINGY